MSFLGKAHTPEAKAKLRAARLSKKHSPETRVKMSAAHRGKKLSPETKAKIAAAMRGKRHTPETKTRMRVTMLAKYGLAPEHFDVYCLARRKGFKAKGAVALAFREAKRLKKEN